MKTTILRAALVAFTLTLGACGTMPQKVSPADPRDPEIYRPAKPVYPMPER